MLVCHRDSSLSAQSSDLSAKVELWRSKRSARRAEVLEFEAQLSSEAIGRELGPCQFLGGLVAAIVRNETALVPRGPTVIEEGDHIVVLAQKDAVDRVARLLRVLERP